MNRLNELYRNTSQRLLHVDRETVDRLFSLLLLGFVSVLFVLTLGYGKDTRLLPMVVLVPTGILLLLLLLFQFVSAIPERIGIQKDATSFDLTELVETDVDQTGPTDVEESSELSPIEKRKRLIQILLWLGGILVLIALLGFIVGFLVFLLAFYYYWTEETLRQSVIYAFLVWGFIVGLFVLILGVPFTGGYVIEMTMLF